jgi:hypothetical protein
LRLVLAVEARAGNVHRSKHAAPGLWKFDSLAPHQKPAVLRADTNWGSGPIVQEAEQRQQPYVFKLRLTKGASARLKSRDDIAFLEC